MVSDAGLSSLRWPSLVLAVRLRDFSTRRGANPAKVPALSGTAEDIGIPPRQGVRIVAMKAEKAEKAGRDKKRQFSPAGECQVGKYALDEKSAPKESWRSEP